MCVCVCGGQEVAHKYVCVWWGGMCVCVQFGVRDCLWATPGERSPQLRPAVGAGTGPEGGVPSEGHPLYQR